MIKIPYRSVENRNLTGDISDALANTYAMLAADEKQKFDMERLAKQDERQAIADAQNKQLFDMKMAEANRMEKARQDEEAYLKGITQPDAYGLRAGTDQVVEALGQYGENPRAKAALAAGQGSAEYEQYFKEMENLGDLITGQSVDDRAIGFATANPNNLYAAKEGLKAGVGRQAALDAEAKQIAADKLKYELEGLKQLGKLGKGTVSTGKTAGGYKVKDPGIVNKDALTLFKSGQGLTSKDALPKGAAQYASELANRGYDSAQISQIMNESYNPKKSGFIWDTDAKFEVSPKIRAKVGTPRNVSTSKSSTAYRDSINALAKSLDQRLEDVNTQRKGEFGLEELQKIVGGTASKAETSKVATKEDKKAIKDTVTKIANKVPSVEDRNISVDDTTGVVTRQGENKNGKYTIKIFPDGKTELVYDKDLKTPQPIVKDTATKLSKEIIEKIQKEQGKEDVVTVEGGQKVQLTYPTSLQSKLNVVNAKYGDKFSTVQADEQSKIINAHNGELENIIGTYYGSKRVPGARVPEVVKQAEKELEKNTGYQTKRDRDKLIRKTQEALIASEGLMIGGPLRSGRGFKKGFEALAKKIGSNISAENRAAAAASRNIGLEDPTFMPYNTTVRNPATPEQIARLQSKKGRFTITDVKDFQKAEQQALLKEAKNYGFKTVAQYMKYLGYK